MGALQGASLGRGAVALLAGEAGIGKTRLADELAKTAVGSETAVVWGRCWEAGGTPAYWPWTQVLRALFLERGVAAVERAAAGRMADLRPLVPELVSSQQAASEIADPVQARFRLFDAVASVLRALSVAAPIVVVLDDLHSADLSSLHLLHFVTRELRSMRVLVIGTYREEEARSSVDRMELIARIAREGAIFPLVRLDAADIAHLVRSELGAEADDELVASLQRSSEGNPLFLHEMLRLIAGSPRRSGDGRHMVPDSVRELIRARLASIDEGTRTLIEFASVFGRELSEPLLVRVANLARSAVRERLEEAAQAGLVFDLGAERWSFSHILIREALYASIATTTRSRLHAALADGLEALGDDSASSLAAIAHHRLLGATESGVRSAVESALVLSGRALRMFALEDAASVLESALRLLEGEPDETELRLKALIALGEARVHLGQRDRAKQACRAAADIARASKNAPALARAALAYGAEFSLGEVDPFLVRLLEGALDVIGSTDPGLRARLSARLAAARQPAADTNEPMLLAREAIALARSIGDDETLRAVIHSALGALVDYAEPEEIVPLCAESIALATAAEDKTQLLRAQGRMVFASLEGGDVVRADAAIAAFESLARELPASLHMSDAFMMRAMRALMEGHFDTADEYTARARELRDPAANPSARAGAMLHDTARDLVQERAERILARAAETSEVLSVLPEVGVDYTHAISACAHARLGQLDLARQHLDAIADDATLLTGEPQGQRVLAEAASLVDDARRAALLEARLGKMRGRVMTWGRMCMVCDAPVTRLLGLLAGVQGRHAEAIALLDDALTRAQAMGLVALLPRLRLELAQELARQGTEPELERARQLLQQAERDAEKLGYAAISRAATELASRLAASPAASADIVSRQPPGAASAFELSREGELYRVDSTWGVARLKDSMGLRLLERLVSSPGREFHVLELVHSGTAGADPGDAGELLDQRAINDYRQRLEGLREAAREAEAFADQDRLSRANAEIEALSGELARGVGLGGRARRAGAASERARINVQRRLRDAVRRIEQCLPGLGPHLAWALKTGVFCSYSPERRT